MMVISMEMLQAFLLTYFLSYIEFIANRTVGVNILFMLLELFEFLLNISATSVDLSNKGQSCVDNLLSSDIRRRMEGLEEVSAVLSLTLDSKTLQFVVDSVVGISNLIIIIYVYLILSSLYTYTYSFFI
jgi:hypothetical protein